MSDKKTWISREKIGFLAIVLLFMILLGILLLVLTEKARDFLNIYFALGGTTIISVFATDIRKRILRCKILSNKWFICGILLVTIASGFLLIKIIRDQGVTPETNLQPEPYNDSIAVVNRQTWFEDKFKEFDSFLKKPLDNVDDNPQIIIGGRSVLRQLNDTMTKYPTEFSDKSLGEYINAFNGRVDIAKKFAETAYNNRLLFDDDTAKYFRRIKEFDKMYFKK